MILTYFLARPQKTYRVTQSFLSPYEAKVSIMFDTWLSPPCHAARDFNNADSGKTDRGYEAAAAEGKIGSEQPVKALSHTCGLKKTERMEASMDGFQRQSIGLLVGWRV